MKTWIKKYKFSIVVAVAIALGSFNTLAWYGNMRPPLRGEEVEVIDPAVREKISIEASKDVYIKNGADLYVYSDDKTTQKFLVDGATGNTTIEGTLQYGADDLYALGFATSGQQAIYGTDNITGTAVAAHGLTTVSFALCTLGKQQDASTAGCSLVVSSNVVTLYTYEDDNTTQSTEASVPVHWLVVGAP